MNHNTIESLTDDEVLTMAMLLGFEWAPAFTEEEIAELADLLPSQVHTMVFGSYVLNEGWPANLAKNKYVAARTYLEHHLPKKP